jgi:hypothetical protein
LSLCTAGALATLLFSSCASSPGSHVRFHDQAACDAIVRFSGWNLITINKPDTREAGFLPLYHFAETEKVLARPDFPHHLAAVICGTLASDSQEAETQQKWSALLGAIGYERVVFLRAGARDQVNGLEVIKDLPLGGTQIAGRN